MEPLADAERGREAREVAQRAQARELMEQRNIHRLMLTLEKKFK